MRDVKKNRFIRIGQIIFFIVITVLIVGALVYTTYGRAIPVLDTKGLIANQERDLIYFTLILGLFVIIPVFIMLFIIAWRYRATNTKAVYQPEFSSHKGLEALWWGIPFVIIIVLAVVMTISTHALDPYKKLESSVEPVNIQVVALQWKWLFIYPDEGIATVNYANIPNNTPVNLMITSDAPMNSFWVPALAGQVYAMAGMMTQLHIMADGTGTYDGVSANISGKGFADMRFQINSMDSSDFKAWTTDAAASENMLTASEYKQLALPSVSKNTKTYMLMDTGLYNKNIMKYMSPSGSHDGMDM
ncbi:ubiquinol oxidase subunit II [soil metagenome]